MNNSELYIRGKEYRDSDRLQEAYEMFLEAAMTEDDGEAMHELGDMYLHGDYVQQAYDKAGYYFGMAYDHGAELWSMEFITAGYCYEDRYSRTGNPEDLDKAISYFQGAIEDGDKYGYECLAKIYFEAGDYDTALKNLKKMNWKNPLGVYFLARMYDEGLGVPADRQKAIDLYRKSYNLDEGMDMDLYSDLSVKRLHALGVM